MITSWDKSHLVTTFLYGAGLAVLIFEDFCVYSWEILGCSLIFLCCIWLWYQGTNWLHRTSWEMFPPWFSGNACEGLVVVLHVWQNLPGKPTWAELFFVVKLLGANSISLPVMGPFRYLILESVLVIYLFLDFINFI